MPLRPNRWRHLAPGLAIAASLTLVAVAIVVFMRPGVMRGRAFRLFVTVSDATGVMKGTQVWLGGQPVGQVTRIGFLPAAADTTNRVVLEVKVLERHRRAVRSDSRVQLRAGGSFIGSPVVHISVGTPGARGVGDGDTIRSMPRTDIEALASRAASGARELPLLMNNVKLVAEQLRSTRGTLGAMKDGVPGMEMARGRAGAIAGSVKEGRGSLGLMLSGRERLMGRASVAMARADSIRALLASGRGNVGRFRRDSTLLRHVAEIRDELSILGHLMSSPDGTMGRMRQDRAVQQGIAEAQREMTALFADLKEHPFRYIRLF